ncbi:hypothetical protein E5288_WYG022105 [Bos mutus]|uniref:Uncharacterized protein n=1 Tax=Bos mutus TaxID=72004 RepID=A0A6B0SD71_9CETA|nr:hypothetical protein [Bos mutus]
MECRLVSMCSVFDPNISHKCKMNFDFLFPAPRKISLRVSLANTIKTRMRCKPGGKPEAEKPPGMAESPAGLDVARAEVKAPRAAVGKSEPVVPGPRPVSNSDPVLCQTQLAIGPHLVLKSDLVCPGPVFKVDTVCPWTQFSF